MSKVPAFFVHAGVKLNSIALEFTRSGPAAATINAIAQGETRFDTTQGGMPSGHVIAIDMDAALRIGAARGNDLAALSELLPAAEAGLVEALCSDRVRDDRF
jgi:hypothetical protein